MPIRSKILLCSALSLTLTACAGTSGPRYVPRPHVPLSQYTDENRLEDYRDLQNYMAYEHREPCQKYRVPPRNMILDNCNLVPEPQQVIVTETTQTEYTQAGLLPIVSTYVIYFDFDKSGVRPSEEETLRRIAQEIRKFNPTQITVTGHADSSGAADYNQDLSRKRADSVVAALEARGIRSEAVAEEARGESTLAVQTGDGVKLQENRRVVVDFRR